MTEKTYRIDIEGGAAVRARPGDTLLEVAAEAGLEVSADCGGAGTCGKCRARAGGLLEPPSDAERKLLSAREIESGVRLACQARISGDAGAVFEGNAVSSEITDFCMEYEPPDSGRGHAPDSERGFGLAIDIGTTTLNARLVDLETGRAAASAASANPQRIYGADVASRLSFAVSGGLGALRSGLRRRVSRMVEWLAERGGVEAGAAKRSIVVGNPTMLSVFFGYDPSGIGAAPFTPPFTGTAAALARELGIPAAEGAVAETLPVVAGYVGADAVSAALRAGLHRPGGPRLMIDLGTNAEMVLAAGGEIWACAAAAGPAFEGAHISCGSTAREGAVDTVMLSEDGTLAVGTIGGAAPEGLCGTGLIDALAVLLDSGALAASGRLTAPEDGPIADRLSGGDLGSQPEFHIVRPGEMGARRPVSITQHDIRESQLAKGAILAGAETLMAAAGVDAASLEAVYLAGALGYSLNSKSAIRIGLLPGARPEIVKFIGNAALDGAADALVSAKAREDARLLGDSIRYFELSSAPGFADRFAAAMAFPANLH
ncbi:MAG TPA: ASKHA domain-containing protein [bacterium]|nr:ASKHA domain-containing protein [bacterium]